jgi:hypothetical protein
MKDPQDWKGFENFSGQGDQQHPNRRKPGGNLQDSYSGPAGWTWRFQKANETHGMQFDQILGD